MDLKPANQNDMPLERAIGARIRAARARHGLSLRALSERSGLNVNTLSAVENGKTSPSVGTLQQLAQALDMPIADFFAAQAQAKRIVFTPAAQRPQVCFGSTRMQNLGQDLAGGSVQPFVVHLKPGMGSGRHMLVHTGHEFVFCLHGSVRYQVEETPFTLHAGDSLLFEAHLPHCWENTQQETAQILLILSPSDQREEHGGRHFSLEMIKKEINMKIAAITEDGKTISQHFGRAQYYLVLTIEEGKIVEREMRSKLGHGQFHEEQHAQETPDAGHGMDATSHNKHVSMAQAIADCKALLCGGMGMGAYESMRQLNIQPIVTDLREIEDAAQAFIDGKLIDHTELLH